MPAASPERVIQIGARAPRARLSVLTPFHRYDPSTLLRRLANAPKGIEFILVDDGSNSAHIVSNVIVAAEALGAPVTVIVRKDNAGRSAARNRLVAEARGEYVLFLDADMAPDCPHFLARWLDIIQRQRPFAACGGLSVRHAEATQETALHHRLFARSDCRDAASRNRAPARFVASANLLVRRDFFSSIGFDNAFTGWGWEDVDWGIRAGERAPILHIDNPATHVGLDSVDTLMRKSAEGGRNFARLAAKHPKAVARYPAFRLAQALKHAPALKALRAAFAWLARDPWLVAPLDVRCAAFKLYRATHYAEHLA